MKQLPLIAALFLAVIPNAHANTDNCSYITRSWLGTFTFKQPETCKKYRGCVHMVSATVQHVDGDNYKVDLRPKAGDDRVFNLTCEEGNITAPIVADSSIKLNCTERGTCAVIYDDPTVHSTMVTAKD